jgi:hypothetical protein
MQNILHRGFGSINLQTAPSDKFEFRTCNVLLRQTSYFEVRATPDDNRLNTLHVSLRWVNQWESIWQLGAHFLLKLRWKATIDLNAAYHSSYCTWAHNLTASENVHCAYASTFVADKERKLCPTFHKKRHECMSQIKRDIKLKRCVLLLRWVCTTVYQGRGAIREIRHLTSNTSVFSKSNIIPYVMFKRMTFHYALGILMINQATALYNVIEWTNVKCTYWL